MSLLNQVFQGNPNTLGLTVSGGSQIAPSVGIDTVNGALYESVGNGWNALGGAVVNKTVQSAITAEMANVVFTVPQAGLYDISAYEVATTATSGTLPTISATFTDADSGTSVTETVVTGNTSSAAGTTFSGRLLVNAKAGTTITLSGASYATATYTVKTRIQFLG
jgi:hypothetical protein